MLRDDNAQAIGNDGHLGIGTLHLKGELERLLDSVDRRHVHILEHLVIAQVGNHDHRVMRQDAGENLARPLVGQGLVLGTIDTGALKLRRVVVGDVVIEALATVTVGTAGDVDDHAALGKRGLGSAHALHGLVDVLVKRVAAVGGDGDLALDGLNAGTKQKIAGFKNLWLSLIDAAGKSDAVAFSEYVLKASGLFDMYKADEAEPDRVENLKEFVSAVNLFRKDNPGKTIEDFLRMVALISDADEIDDSNSVTLATIHAVKGLEFPVVFIVALEENIFPSSHAVIESDDNIEEERRLMYVAITRAKERLYVSSSRCRFRFNQRQNNLRSRFVQELIGNVPAKTPQTPQSGKKKKLPGWCFL